MSDISYVNLPDGVTYNITDLDALHHIIVPDYDATSTYNRGDFATYQGDVYICDRDISTPEPWNQYDWELAHAHDDSYLHSLNPNGAGSFGMNRKPNTTVGYCSFAEGLDNEASGGISHAEGSNTVASGSASHAEGGYTEASGGYSHAEGYDTVSSGAYSHAEGDRTISNHQSQHVFGAWNIEDPSSADSSSKGNYVEIVGNGTKGARSNARTLDWSGNEVLSGGLTSTSVSTTTLSATTLNGVTIGSSPKFTDTTYSLSTSGNDVILSADGTAQDTITVPYATSADSATKLGTSTVGGTTTPIYLNAGVPTALSYTIAKSVPSNAVFTDTMVTQSLSSTNAHYPILFSYAGNADTTANVTNICYRNNSVYINPSTGNIRAVQLNGVTIGSSPKFTDTTYESKTAASGGTAVSLCTTGEKYTWNNSPRMYTNTYPTLFDTAGGNNWIRIGTNNSYGLLPPNSGGSGSGHGYLGTASWYWGNLYVDNVYSNSVLNRATFVSSSTTYSANDMHGCTRFLYTTHGVPHSGTTVAFDSSNSENYTLQLNANYGGATSNARLSFRTRNGDTSTWSNWLYACPIHRFNTRLEPNTSTTLYVPLEMRNGTAGDSYFLVLSGNYGSGGFYFLTPNTVAAHQMQITSIKTATATTIVAVSDDWGFKITLGSVAYYATLIRLS